MNLKKEYLSIVIAIILVISIIVLLFSDIIRFSDVSSAVAYVLVGGIITVLVWGLKHKISSETEIKNKKKSNDEPKLQLEKKPKSISHKTTKIRLDEYEEMRLNLKNGQIITGEILSDGFCNVYFLTESSYNSFKNDNNFKMIDGAEDITNYKPNFKVLRKGIYYIVLENADKKNIVIRVDLYVE